ncbi:MAG: ABC transporter ATP-binding protein [Bacteroidota bacterium]|nr:ABC transporter ATP-binding protein [Bacteroidota bacterium]
MLEINNLNINFKEFNISDVSFSVDRGDYFVLLGKSGAGKTLILEMIAGLLSPKSGNIVLNNKDITRTKIQLRKVGLVFQDYAIFPHMSVFENIAYPLKTQKLKSKEIRNLVGEYANDLEISHLLKRSPKTLSGGELQRVALARTLILKPELLLLDEPLSSLDIQLRKDLRSLLRKLNKSGQTIIHVTHDYEDAVSLANKIAVMDKGVIEQCGTTKEIFQNPKSEFVAEFTGTKNFFKAHIESYGEENLKKANINNKLSVCLYSETKSGEGFIKIRNKNIILSDKKLEMSTQNNFKGEVVDVIHAHFGYEIFVDIGVVLSVLISRESFEKFNIREGKSIWLSFKASSVKFYKGFSKQ